MAEKRHSKPTEKQELDQNIPVTASRKLFRARTHKEHIELLVIFCVCFLVAFVIAFLSFAGTLRLSVIGDEFAGVHFALPGFGSASDAQAVYDPYVLYLKMIRDPGSVLIVDVRSAKEYKAGHLMGAINYPFYTSLNNVSDSGVDAAGFARTVSSHVKDKQQVIVYGYSMNAQSATDAVSMLRTRRVPAERLGVGWNEWYHFKAFWVPEGAWNSVDVDRSVSLPD